MSITLKTILGLATLAIVSTAIALFIVSSTGNANAGAGSIPALQGFATTTAVGPQENIAVFSNKSNCSARVISTTDGTGANIWVLFGDPSNGDVASTSLPTGHYQAGSTTQAYDASIYGCGTWYVYGEASTTLMVSEMR